MSYSLTQWDKYNILFIIIIIIIIILQEDNWGAK